MMQKLVYTFTFLILLVTSAHQTNAIDGNRFANTPSQYVSLKGTNWWEIQAIDTMKYSRDIAREKLTNEAFKEQIDMQVGDIALTGANYVSIATPYDEEFIPFLQSWVAAARKYNLKVWFRGNWSGWEGWFEYPEITREEHIKKSVEFVKAHHDLFEDGDIFSACPECENGGPGDPRQTGDIEGHRKFIIEEHAELKRTFQNLGRNVRTNFYPMNGDVAKAVMDANTTKAMGGLVVIDHYVQSPQKLNQDVNEIAAQSGGKVFLGEFGAPIPDIHGNLTEEQQAKWIEDSLELLSTNPNLIGLNYWVNIGGSTQIWSSKNVARPAVAVLKKYFSPFLLSARVENEIGDPIVGADVYVIGNTAKTNKNGEIELKSFGEPTEFEVVAYGYQRASFSIISTPSDRPVILIKEHESIFFKIQKAYLRIVNSLFGVDKDTIVIN